MARIWAKIKTLFILVDCVWSDWTPEWTTCSKDCGGGSQSKTRSKSVVADHGGQECTGDTEKVQACNTTECDDGKSKYTIIMACL